MSSKSSVYPNFYRCYLNQAVGGLTVGTDVGFGCPYDSDLNYIPLHNIQGDTTFARTPNGYTEYNALYRYYGYSRINPFVDCKEANISQPLISSFTSTKQYYKSNLGTYTFTSGTYSGQTYEINLWFYWYKSGGTYTLGVVLYLDDGNTPSSVSGERELYAKSGVTDEEAISTCNSLLRNIHMYICGSTEGSRGSLSLTTYTTTLRYCLEVGDGYFWGGLTNRIGGNIEWLTLAETTEKYTPEPEPEPPTPSDDPYNPGGYSGSGGGPNPGGTGATGTGGLHDDTSDPIPTPNLPSSIATGSGLFTAYNPDASQLAYFASKLWNMQPTDINDVLRFLFGGDAFNAIIGLHLLPVQPDTSGSPNIMLGNWDTGAPAPKIVNQYKQIPFGSLMLPEYWGNCIDYAPYTKIQLALPYIGIVDVDTDDVLGSNNTLTYNIDVLSGAVCAILHCVKGNLNSVIYQWSGACAVSLPFSGASYNSVLSAIAGIGAAGMGFAALAAGPLGAALPASALAAGAGAFGAGSAASILGTMKGKVQKSGSFGANSGALGIMKPYFILTRPVQSVPASWQADKGYPANISAQLGTLTGYTEVSEINLECSGTEAEKKEIIDLLKKGVLF